MAIHSAILLGSAKFQRDRFDRRRHFDGAQQRNNNQAKQ
jgi:hypothetical protein